MFFFFIPDEARVLGRTLGHVRRVLYTVLCIPRDIRAHRPVYITGRAQPFTVQVSPHRYSAVIFGL